MRINELPERKCAICNTPFKPLRANQKYCDNPECKKIGNALRAKEWKKTHYRSRERPEHYRTRKVQHSELSKRRRKPEKVLVENMLSLNKNVTNDSELLKRKGIRSPDLSTIRYRYYDPALKITHFFTNKKRYQNFLKTLNK